MNRLVIIGNGFDLAHGLPTGYCDFINDYWRKVGDSDYADNFISFSCDRKASFPKATSLTEIIAEMQTSLNKSLYCNPKGVYYQTFSRSNGEVHHYNQYVLSFSNSFFGEICNKQKIQNWVDIENEYYKLLKDCLKEESDNLRVVKLNKEFESVKNLLEQYLYSNITQNFCFDKPNKDFGKIPDLFVIKPLKLKENPEHNYLKEFSKQDHQWLIDYDNSIVEASNSLNLQFAIDEEIIIQNNLFLNFNYTPSLEKYINYTLGRNILTRRYAFGNMWQIQIHGKLMDDTNKVNFGFGDEMDDDYKLLERKDDNEYLKNIKSFQYLQNSNYKDMLDFIESSKFQVYIMGHSCGLSDRILLNKIFEHHNCRSIKVFYHQFDQPKPDGRIDNYTEIVQNISRHFNKKEMMREKIVNKSLCQPLPQTIRFEKKNGPQS